MMATDAELRAAMIAELEEMDAAGVRTPYDGRRLGAAARFCREVALAAEDSELLEVTDRILRRWKNRIES